MPNPPYVITLFGAESTGKTTLSRQLAHELHAEWKEEFARGYLERTGEGVTRESMRAIWHGQKMLQASTPHSSSAYVVQDTDLFSTVGYWQLPHVAAAIGDCPARLIIDADKQRSDLYIITCSNIPFEPDVLRYGGDKRESLDSYWIRLCETYDLPYIVLRSGSKSARLNEALLRIKERNTLCMAS